MLGRDEPLHVVYLTPSKFVPESLISFCRAISLHEDCAFESPKWEENALFSRRSLALS